MRPPETYIRMTADIKEHQDAIKQGRLRQDTLKAWFEYEETGLYVSDQEADAWLDRLEQGIDTVPPAPHT